MKLVYTPRSNDDLFSCIKAFCSVTTAWQFRANNMKRHLLNCLNENNIGIFLLFQWLLWWKIFRKWDFVIIFYSFFLANWFYWKNYSQFNLKQFNESNSNRNDYLNCDFATVWLTFAQPKKIKTFSSVKTKYIKTIDLYNTIWLQHSIEKNLITPPESKQCSRIR